MFVIINTECFHDDDDNDDNGVDNTSGKVSLFAVDFQLNFVLFNVSVVAIVVDMLQQQELYCHHSLCLL